MVKLLATFVYWRVDCIAVDSIVDGSIVCDAVHLDEEIALLDKEDVTPFFLDPSDMSSFQLSKTIWDMIRWWVRGSFLQSAIAVLYNISHFKIKERSHTFGYCQDDFSDNVIWDSLQVVGSEGSPKFCMRWRIWTLWFNSRNTLRIVYPLGLDFKISFVGNNLNLRQLV